MSQRHFAFFSALAVVVSATLVPASVSADDLPVDLATRAPAAAGPVESIVWNLPTGEPGLIDPPNAPTFSGAGVVSNLCDALLTVDDNLALKPNIVDFRIPDPKTLIYTLVDGATFWDGTPVTAEDVAFSLQRSAKPEQLVSFLYASISTIEVTGTKEVTVTFKEPDSMFNNEMATFAGMVISKAHTEATEAAGKKIGTPDGGIMCSGPFQLKEWVSGDHITITRNENYWNKDRMALPGEVKFVFVTDSAAYVQAMIAGEIDGSYEISPVAIQALTGVESGNLYLGPSTQYVTFAAANPGGVMGDLNLRGAFQLMLDRQGVADSVYSGAADPLYTHVTPLTWQQGARDIYQAAYDEFASARAFDQAKAAELVKASSFAGEELVLAVTAGDETLGLLSQYIQQQAAAIGVKVSIKALQPLEYAEAGYDATKRVGIDLMLTVGFNAAQDPLEPVGFVYTAGGFYNWDGFDDADVTRLMAEMRSTSDLAGRAAIFVEMQKIYEAKTGTVPVVAQNTVTFLNKRLGGAVTSFAYMSMPALAYIGAAH